MNINLQVQKQSPISVREQIKRQIRLMIENQVLTAGKALPSARDMSALIRVNRNTVTQAYKELSSEGFLEIVPGSGTFVKKSLSLKPKAVLNEIFNDAFQKAKASGFNQHEIAEHFLSCLSALDSGTAGKKVVVVDCNDGVIKHLCGLVSNRTGVRTAGVLIQELEQGNEPSFSLLKESDLIVCGFNHLEELENAVPDLETDVVAVLLQVEARVINSFFSIPKGTSVGFVCANERSTHTLYNSSYFSGNKSLHRILAGYDDSKKLKSLIRECEIVFVTEFVFDRVAKIARPDQELVRVSFSVDPGIMDLIREKLSL